MPENQDSPAEGEGGPHSPDDLPSQPSGDEGPDIEAHRLDSDAVRVVLRLRQHGHEAYLVGGCVRDLLIGREPKDFDIATSATPDEVRSLFRNSRLIGRRFRLAHVYFKGGKILEVSTFRATPQLEEPAPAEAAEADAQALDAVEHDAPPAEVPSAEPAPERDFLITEDNTFGSALDDALRRDFTINGLFYDPAAGRVIDHVWGLRDLAQREIRTIGEPEKRMREDPVRILRAVRFAAKLSFDIEPRTYAAMEGAVEDLARCSLPRLLEESFRLIRSGCASQSLRMLAALDAVKTLLPPIGEYLAAQDAGGIEEYFRFLAVMDERVAQEGALPFDDSMLLACILLPVAIDEADPMPAVVAPVSVAEAAPPIGEAAASVPAPLEEEQRPTLAQAIEALLFELVQKARLPRRIAERCRMMLMAQRTLSGQRRRRGGLASFRGHPLFKESLEVFAVWVKATGDHEEALAKWRSGVAPSVSADAEGPRRRRRRRRKGGNRGTPASA
jgi:poly(A) polymerase